MHFKETILGTFLADWLGKEQLGGWVIINNTTYEEWEIVEEHYWK